MLTAASCLSTNHLVSVFWDSSDILNVAQRKFDIDLSKVVLKSNIFASNVSFIKRFFETKKFDAIFFLSDGSIPIVGSNLYVHFQFPVEWVNADSLKQLHKTKRIKKIVCNSLFTKRYIDLKFKINSTLVYPPTYFKSNYPKVSLIDKKNIILNVGRYMSLPNNTSFKKQEFMIKVFKDLVDDGLKGWVLNLVISYHQNDLKHIESLKNSIQGYPIKILENLYYEQLAQEYKKAKIYWHASGFGEDLQAYPQRAEHFGITTVEAMINGLVPIVINAGGQSEIVTDEKSGFLWNFEKDFKSKTLSAITDEKLLNKLSIQAQKSAIKFSTDNFCENINKVFI